MAEAHLDHPGEVTWFAGERPLPVLGPCPHVGCPHNMSACIAWGPDYEHYALVECQVDLGCAGTCRAWESEIPQPRGGVKYAWGPYLHVDVR